MPGPITYAAVTLLARDRIGQIKRALAAKKGAGTAKELELHVLHLATEAERIMKAAEPVIEPPVRLYGPPLTDQVSRFLLLGAVGPDLPRYAAYFAPGQRWLVDTLHKGTPDEHRELVLANTTNLVFDFWKTVGPMITTDLAPGKKDSEALDKMRAYVLGHVCHIATDVLSHPYFEAIEARLAAPGPPPVRFMSRDDVAAAFDVRVSDTFFGRGTDTRTKQWADWFPTPGDVPSAFARAMAASIEKLYGARAEGLPAFEEAFKKIDPAPPPLSEGLIKESIEYFRTIIEIERVWTFADWLGATAAMFVPMAFAYFGALALPLGKDLSRTLTDKDDGPGAEDIRTYEWVVFPLAASSLLGPLVTMIIVSASGRGLRAEGVTGWVQALLSLGASIGFFATRGGAGAARWVLWFVLPLVLAAAQFIFVLRRGAQENSRKLLWFGPLFQVGLALLFMLLYRAWLHEGVEELQKDTDERDDAKAFGYFAAWISIVVAVWILWASLWRWVFSKPVPDDRDELERAEPRQFLRLYDDVALVHARQQLLLTEGKPFESDKLADLAYPPARRPLLKLWWVAGTAPSVKLRIDHDRLVFHWDAPPGTADLSVFAPIAPMTVDRFGQLLAAAVTHAAKGTLHVEPVRDDEKGFELAPGAVFSDHGDDKTTLADHDAAAASFKEIGTSEAAAFTLFHAPRPRLAERMGQSGPARDGRRDEQATKDGTLLQTVVGNPRRYHATDATDGTSPRLRRLLSPGDVLEIASGGPTGEQRIVEQVISDTDVLVVSPFIAPILAAGIKYKRAASDRGVRLRGRSTVSTPTPAAGIGPNDVRLDIPIPTTAFGSQFAPGDVVEIGGTSFQRRRVVAVKDATNLLELDAPLFPPAGGASAPGSLLQPLGGATPKRYRATGASPRLTRLLRAGDVIEIASGGPPGEQQVVQEVLSDTDVVMVTAFAAVPPGGIGYKRVTYIERPADVDVDGFPFVADPDDVFGDGHGVMNDAADLAALLCLGAASRLAPNNTQPTPDGATQPVHRVSQVFRNWNLDRRRVNEWKLLVSGGAVSERRGDYAAPEEAAPIDPLDAGDKFTVEQIAARQTAEATVRDLGWLGVFRSWIDLSSHPRTDIASAQAFRPGSASNLDLTRAMAYLLDATPSIVP